MDYYKKFVDQISFRIFGWIILVAILVGGSAFGLNRWLEIDDNLVYILLAIETLVLTLAVTLIISKQVGTPFLTLQQLIIYTLRPDPSVPEPDLNKLKIGRQMVEAIWQLVQSSKPNAQLANTDTTLEAGQSQVGSSLLDFVCENSPLPIIAVDNKQVVQFANKAAREYFGLTESPVGKELFAVVNLSFTSEETYDVWLKYCRQNKVTDSRFWERVRAKVDENNVPKQFDMAASYTKDATSGSETILTLFDQSDRYAHDDRDVSFLALAVHELRTPLTIIRGYIEVFEDEVGPTLDPEMQAFMHKLNAAAQQLTAFIGHILNMARVEENQLTLALREEDWQTILETAINDMKLRAEVHGKTIELAISPDLPKVAVDRIGIQEVINNLVENAVKYGGQSNKILVNSQVNSEGLIETSVTDFGVGIPQSILPHLFEKFYRSHRSRGTASGTGLGLYLCHAVIKAHGGSISAESHEGKGSTFTFTLLPYSAVEKQQQDNPDSDGIIRGAHGWIKNHNLYKQ